MMLVPNMLLLRQRHSVIQDMELLAIIEGVVGMMRIIASLHNIHFYVVAPSSDKIDWCTTVLELLSDV